MRDYQPATFFLNKRKCDRASQENRLVGSREERGKNRIEKTIKRKEKKNSVVVRVLSCWTKKLWQIQDFQVSCAFLCVFVSLVRGASLSCDVFL